MAIRHLVWACVLCGKEGTLEPSKKVEVCTECGARYSRGRGQEIFVQQQGSEGRAYSPHELCALLPPVVPIGTAACEVRQWVADQPLHLFGRYLGRFERLGGLHRGTLSLDEQKLRFRGESDFEFEIPLVEITAIQPSSSTLQVKAKKRPLLSIRFSDSSPMLWEQRLQLALDRVYANAGLGEITEYQPRVAVRSVRSGAGAARLRRRLEPAMTLSPGRPWQYRLASWLARNAWKYFGGGLSVDGLENIPPTGPFLVLVNHQSYLETMLVPAVMQRAAHMMAKSTQFSSRITGWLMARLFTFPVRRFEIDPHAVRYALNRMMEGYGIVVFIEGERTWDGVLQPARLGTVRLALDAAVPVIPCRVSGAYAAWPRWSSRAQRHPIQVRFGQPLRLPRTDHRADREARLDEAVRLTRAAIDPGI